MAFQARHRFIIQKINDLLSINDEIFVENALKEENNFDAMNKFLRGSGGDTLFFYFQSLDGIDEDGNEAPGEGQKILFATNGLREAIRSKAIYFCKTPETLDGPRRDLDLTVAYDGKLSYGVVSPDVLKSMETLMSVLLIPPMAAKNADWGKATSVQSTEYIQKCHKGLDKIQEVIKSMNTGLALRKLGKKIDLDTNNLSVLINDEEVISHFTELLEDWCVQTENYLDDTDQSRYEHADVGPDTELDYWRRRLQRLTSITEQLKTKDFKVVIMTLSALTRNIENGEGDSSEARNHVYGLLRRWKQIDIGITEASTEARDNVKYLATLEKFIEPLYSGTPEGIRDALPALMNGIKMIHTIARYYNTKERMTNLFRKITNQMINNCKKFINGDDPPEAIWTKDTDSILRSMQSCLKLNETYQEQYRLTKDKLMTIPKGKQFEFPEHIIFGKFDLFCRRIIKLIDLFSTIQQFSALSNNGLEGVDLLIKRFNGIVQDFRKKKHHLLDVTSSQFDRDFVEFNMHIADLEDSLQQHINASFEKITSIEDSLALLKKFKKILQRESLKEDLESKFMIIFHNYGLELQAVEELYNLNKHAPPVPRNMPPVSGNIMWSRHLLHRIEAPMSQFETNQGLLGTKESKRIVKSYNKVARTLVAFEYLWYEAWCKGIEAAKSGLLATLIVRHPKTSELFVNFDQEILQLIREAKCLNRMGIEIPDNARLVMLQEEKFKKYHNDLTYLLQEHARVTSLILPVTKQLFVRNLKEIDFKLNPGLTTLTWNSMNIDAYKHNVTAGLQKLEALIIHVNDVIENIIEKNLKVVSRVLLVDLPKNSSFSPDEFVALQKRIVESKVSFMEAKNVQIEQAVEEVMKLIKEFQLEHVSETVSVQDFLDFKKHYFKMMYNALLKSCKESLTVLKKRVCSRGGTGFLFVDRPFFEVDVQLSVPATVLSPSVDDIQNTINKAAYAVLQATKSIWQWDQAGLSESSKKLSFFDLISCDLEIVRVVLLLTGGIQGTRNQVQQYLSGFKRYDWLWKDDKESVYKHFISKKPVIEDFEREMKHFVFVENDVMTLPVVHNIGALSLHTQNLKLQLRNECRAWKVQFSSHLHVEARQKLNSLFEYINSTTSKLGTVVDSLDSLKYVMNILKEIRERESVIEMELGPVLEMYDVLEKYLPSSGLFSKEEMDMKGILRTEWNKLADLAEVVTDGLVAVQSTFKLSLLKDIKTFTNDIKEFRVEYLANGPMVPGIKPLDAVSALKRFKSEFEVRERKMETLAAGEDLFALKHVEYAEMIKTKKELGLLDLLYGLYVDVVSSFTTYRDMLWSEATKELLNMQEKVESFNQRCIKLPKKLREWDAYSELESTISNFQTVLPILINLSRDSMKPRHWTTIQMLLKIELPLDGEREFTLQKLLDSKIIQFKDEIDEICDSAEKQLEIEKKLTEIQEHWATRDFSFNLWKDRSYILSNMNGVFEELEESIVSLQSMATMRQAGPFAVILSNRIAQLNDVVEVCENWMKVQSLWLSLEGVFLSGDISKQMPIEAKKFMKIDKDYEKIMLRTKETGNIVQSCTNDLLKSALPILHSGLEGCQKSLDGYLEQKRNLFPRFYFVANSILLQLLSQGEPSNVQLYYEKMFDSISRVDYDSAPIPNIVNIVSVVGAAEEVIPLKTPVPTDSNLEIWLLSLEKEMQRSLKLIVTSASTDCLTMPLRQFVDKYPGQVSLLGLQLSWTFKCEEALMSCKTSKTIMSSNNKTQMETLSELSSWCLMDLGSQMNRVKIESLVTIQVHQRDVFAEICKLYKERKITDAQDFEWLKQGRFYFRPKESDGKGPGATVISFCDVQFKYNYEYLGCKERLVVTPLTDRAYITLTQAINMHLGGAPTGPAGTGKTETVKDLGRSLGNYVIVVNCTNQQRFRDLGKIFKGLCQSGFWGCLDEFNRIELPVLSVVSQQILAISNALRSKSTSFLFPGEEKEIKLVPSVGYFITMNPSYQGRQSLPENLKSLFRFVAMMIPDREIILKVKLCSVGYTNFSTLAKKFNVLYRLCEEQLSKQKHYDFGLRNILSVLRTAGQIKRNNLAEEEEVLIYRVLRDLNLSKFVAEDVPIFLSLLNDLFPTVSQSDIKEAPSVVKSSIKNAITERGLIQHASWEAKVLQYYETLQVRHGLMLVGPSGSGKSEIINTACVAVQAITGVPHKTVWMNPKAILESQMFGETDKISGEWVDGVFSKMWSKYNNKSLKNNTWIVCDGPVDALWIENLNTVLDDNKILTLANGDRIPMSDSVKLNFEVENLRNASPATVSRTGIIYVSSTDLGWKPVAEKWVTSFEELYRAPLSSFVSRIIGGEIESIPVENRKDIFSEFDEGRESILPCSSRVGVINGLFSLLKSLIQDADLSVSPNDMEIELERLFLFAVAWSFGGLLEAADRIKLDNWMRDRSTLMPSNKPPSVTSPVTSPVASPVKGGSKAGNKDRPGTNTKGKGAAATDNKPSTSSNTGSTSSSTKQLPNEPLTIFNYFVERDTNEWSLWKVPDIDVKGAYSMSWERIIVPTITTTSTAFIFENVARSGGSMLLTGVSGSTKTTTSKFYLSQLKVDQASSKHFSLCSSTTARNVQNTIEIELEKRGGRTFGPIGGKQMTFFIDDISMPEPNLWGDQPPLELLRQLLETKSLAFLENDKRGDFKNFEDLSFIVAMSQASNGKNSIPSRLCRQFFSLNLLPISPFTIDCIFGVMFKSRLTSEKWNTESSEAMNKIITTTVSFWNQIRKVLLPTPTKFHYAFSLRDISRVLLGILRTSKDVLNSESKVASLWRYECERVFSDRFTMVEDKTLFLRELNSQTSKTFGKHVLDEMQRIKTHWIHFGKFQASTMPSNDVDIESPGNDLPSVVTPLLYESIDSIDGIKNIVAKSMSIYNKIKPSQALSLVLFDDAVTHVAKISRVLASPTSNLLAIGVGGSGKRSLIRLSTFLCGSELFEISLSKNYSINSFLDDMRTLIRKTGQHGKSVTFLLSDSDIKFEVFLQYICDLLCTGDISGLFPKDEMSIMINDVRDTLIKENGSISDDSNQYLRDYFNYRVKRFLHIALAFSPMDSRYTERARRFPALFNECTINWFLPWPQNALMDVGHAYLDTFEPLKGNEKLRNALIAHTSTTHGIILNFCEEYYNSVRRRVYHTPKSYLLYLESYMKLYTQQLSHTTTQESNINLGLKKLTEGAEDIEKLKVELAKKEVAAADATKAVNDMVANLQLKSLEAKKESDIVGSIRDKCVIEAGIVANEKSACEEDLAKALPYLEEASEAVMGIKPADLVELKKLPKPSDIVKLVFDCVLILKQLPLKAVVEAEMVLGIGKGKNNIPFFEDSYEITKSELFADANLLKSLFHFSKYEKDHINDETVELLAPYLDLEEFDPSVAKNASQALEGLCIWVRAMVSYTYASKFVKPKLEALAVAEAKLRDAQVMLAKAEDKLAKCKLVLEKYQREFESQMTEKGELESMARSIRHKMTRAAALIEGLAGERIRWGDDAKLFAEVKKRLVGNIALGSAFLSYCGPFNQDKRSVILGSLIADMTSRNIPFTPNLDLSNLLVDGVAKESWKLEGLPSDSFSIQNGILVTRGSRYPLLIDPQGQGLSWICSREKDRLPSFGVTSLLSLNLREQLEYCLSEGKTLIIPDIETELDPVLEPVLKKQLITKGKNLYLQLGDKLVAYNSNFNLIFTTRLANPFYTPELQAIVTVVDFTVTQSGLEEQLLGAVIDSEQKELEKQLSIVLSEVAINTQSLLNLNSMLLERLSANQDNLLDDLELIDVLASTKEKANVVKEKLSKAASTKKIIDEKRELYRPAAIRGSILYFCVVSLSNVNHMYQTSLNQFLSIFIKALDESEPSLVVMNRVSNIISTLTYSVYRNVNRGLFESHKLVFKLLMLLNILVSAGYITANEVGLFLKGGSTLDPKEIPTKRLTWMSDTAWANCVRLSQTTEEVKDILGEMGKSETSWKRWCNETEPEKCPTPSFDSVFYTLGSRGTWLKFLLVRCLRDDRTRIYAHDVISSFHHLVDLPVLGPSFTEPVTDTFESILQDADNITPVIYFVSAGSDPTETIEHYTRKKKIIIHTISMGEGQDIMARSVLESAFSSGHWVLLQNCHLDLVFMKVIETLLLQNTKSRNPDFRIFLTTEVVNDFPVGLLQVAIKVTNEPPSGLRAGMIKNFTVAVNQDKLDKIENHQWRSLITSLCFLHSVIQERRRYGPLGFNVPYEFNHSDLAVSLAYLETHMYGGGVISWQALQYIIGEVHYGGKITDSMDRRLFNAYATIWITQATSNADFRFNPLLPLGNPETEFIYTIPLDTEISVYRDHFGKYPSNDSPEIFGLHPNAELSVRINEVNHLFSTLVLTQPKVSSMNTPGSLTREEEVLKKAQELLEKIPVFISEQTVNDSIHRVLNNNRTAPMVIFLIQEIQYLNIVVSTVQDSLVNLISAIKGEIVMTKSLNNILNSIYDVTVPNEWVYIGSSGDIISWLSSSLSVWYTMLLDRHKQLKSWIELGPPKSFWFSGFFNPSGFLTAVKQEVTRNHSKDKWCLDDIVLHTEITENDEVDSIRSHPKEGVYIHGLFLEGASWNKSKSCLVESIPKVIHSPMPVIYITGTTSSAKRAKLADDYGPYGPFECGVYKYPSRTDKHLIFTCSLPTYDKPCNTWILRGVALLCSTAN